MKGRRAATLDLTAIPEDRIGEAQEVMEALLRIEHEQRALRGRGASTGTFARHAPQIGGYLIPPGGARIRIVDTPWVREDLRVHLAPGTVHDAVPDPEMRTTPVRVRPRLTIPVRQHAALVRTPAGDVTVWPGEYEIVTEVKP